MMLVAAPVSQLTDANCAHLGSIHVGGLVTQSLCLLLLLDFGVFVLNSLLNSSTFQAQPRLHVVAIAGLPT